MLNKNLIIKTLLTFFVILPSLFLNSGCALFNTTEPVDHNDKSLSIVYGYFDMENAPSWGGIDWVSIKQFKPEVLYYPTGVEEGLFWYIGARNGSSIQVDQFGRNTRWYSNTMYTYNFGSHGRNETSLIIKKPGAYYMGSYKYKGISSDSFFQPDNFEMIKTKAPSEKELLRKLIKIMQEDHEFTKYTHQMRLLKKRLKRLGK